MNQRIYSEFIGTINNNGIDGTETYYSIKCENDFTEQEMQDAMKKIYCYDSKYPGAKFCDMVHVTHKKYTKNEAVAIVYERYDV